jgi:hypothetical protein
MKRQKSCGPRLGKLVHQLPGVVTFAYDLRFRACDSSLERSIRGLQRSRQNSIVDAILREQHTQKKHRLGPQNGPRSSGPEKTAKNSKLPKLPESCFEPFGKGGWPPISTWIIPRSFLSRYPTLYSWQG